MTFSWRPDSGILRLPMPVSARTITAVFLLLVAASHQTRECAVPQVQAAWLARQGAVECSVHVRGLRPGADRSAPCSAYRPDRGPVTVAPRRRVMSGDLPAPRAPNV